MPDVICEIKPERAATFVGPKLGQFHFRNDETHPGCLRLKELIKNTIGALYRETGIHQYISGIKPGVEMWASEIVLETMKEYPDMELFCILPSDGQASKWNRSIKQRSDSILRNCTGLFRTQDEIRESGDCVAARMLTIKHTCILIAVSEMTETYARPPVWAINKARERGNRIVHIA